MKHRSRLARLVLVLSVGLVSSLLLAGCRAPLYYYTQNQYANRTVPPSGLQQRVLAAYTTVSQGQTGATNGGGAEILDGLRDIRSNIQNTIPAFIIGGLSVGYPSRIINFPEQQFGYVYDYNSGSLTGVNYATEKSASTVASFSAQAPVPAAAPDGSRFIGATVATIGSSPTGSQLYVVSGGGTYMLNLPNVNRVFMNPGNSIMLATTRNSNTLYRVVQLAATNNPVQPPGAVDCEPLLLPLYCVVPVAGTYDHPTNAYFSLDGTKAYILNSGPEDAGTTASISVLNTSALTVTALPTVDPLSAGAPSPLATLPVANPVPIPGGVTDAVSDGTNLYVSGQSQYRLTSAGTLGTTPASDGLFTGYMTIVNESTFAVSNPVSISDGTHTKMLLADNNTLWIGSQHCANGEREATGQNYNCLTMVQLGSGSPTATVIPAVTPGGTTTVGYPNTNGDLYYYGDLTGICWVQGFNKVFTAYGGQVHAFYTGGPITNGYDPARGTTPAAGTELNNTNFTVQGTVLDVAYMDALTNAAN